MHKKILSVTFSLVFLLLAPIPRVQAQTFPSCTSIGMPVNVRNESQSLAVSSGREYLIYSELYGNLDYTKTYIEFQNAPEDGTYSLLIEKDGTEVTDNKATLAAGSDFGWPLTRVDLFLSAREEHSFEYFLKTPNGRVCLAWKYKQTNSNPYELGFDNVVATQLGKSGCFDDSAPILLQLQGVRLKPNLTFIEDSGNFATYGGFDVTTSTHGRGVITLGPGGNTSTLQLTPGGRQTAEDIQVEITNTGSVSPLTINIPVQAACSDEQRNNGNAIELLADYGSDIPFDKFDLCSQIPSSNDQHGACITCQNSNGIWTAVGCIHTELNDIIKAMVTVGISIAGGAAFLMILAAGFMLSVSQGDPKRTSEAREMITSAIIGLLFIIFSVTILKFIGVDILQIPDFGSLL